MPAYDFTAPRLFVDVPLEPGGLVPLDKPQQTYLQTVLRLQPGATVLVFNGRDGEFRAAIEGDRKRAALRVAGMTRPQTPLPTLRWLFAPLKHARLDYMVQKAVEMGVGSLEPVITRRTQVSRINLDRMRANVVEAAEQCGVIAVPQVVAERPLAEVLAGWDASVPLVHCDEAAEVADPIAALAPLAGRPAAVLIGPEGGFDEGERRTLAGMAAVVRIALGPRILRADTAAVAALALLQAVAGDWRG
jgi:16S rRNA (uracil1498-N3)-methyltransferase